MKAACKKTAEKAHILADYHRIHFEDSRDVLFVLDHELTVKAASPSLERVLGYKPEDAEKRRAKLDRFLLPGQGPGIRRLVRAALAGRETWPAVCEARTRDGGTRTLEFVAGRTMGRGAGKTLAVSARDITEWQRLAEAVRQSELKYRGMVEATDTGFVILDGQGRVLDANREYLRLTGRKQFSAIQGIHVSEWTAPHDRERNRAEVARCLRRGSVRMLELDYQHPDGTVVPVEINATAVESDSGLQIVSMVRDISRRRDVENALRDSERQYRLLVQNQGEGIGIVDQAERFVFANPAAEDVFGVKPGGLIGRTLREFTSPEQYAETVRQTGLRRQGQKSTYEMGIRRRDGQERRLLVTATPQLDRQGRFTGTFGIFRDITEREKAEEALRKSEHLYRTVVETSTDAITVSDLAGKVVAANQKAADMQGVPGPSHLIGLDVFGFIAPEDRDRAADNAKKVLSGKPVESVEYRLLRRDGSTFDCELSASLLPGADGRPAGFVAAVRDVTERKRAEEALRESDEKYRTLIDQASDGIMLMPVGGAGFTVNQSFARMHGYGSPQEMANLRLEDLDTPESAGLIKERLGRMLAGEHLRFEVEHYHRDGHAFPLQVSCSVVRIGETAYFLGFHRDITEQRRLEKEVLEIGDRVQYHIGHDLHDGVNQLLTVASLRVGALQQKLNEGRLPDEGELAALSGLVRQTMDQVSFLARGLSPLSLKTGGLALGLTELCKTTSTLGVECRVSLDESVKVNDLAAATHLYRIAQEAVNNSLKHSGASLIEISLYREKANAVLAVSDDGRGMAGNAKTGGMGMNIMKYRAGMIGAEMEIAPGRKGGTVVRCVFPWPAARERN